MTASNASDAFACVRLETDAERAEWASAEAFAAGATGVEERTSGSAVLLLIYAPSACAEAVRDAVLAVAGDDANASVEPVAARDWPETWKQGLAPIEISPRLLVRPDFAGATPASGQVEVVIEPRQAFGTGAHGSTALALALLDERLATAPVARVLDVGCGSGVLAIAARRLGAREALACDLDPIAARETRENALRNAAPVASFAGSLDALGAPAGTFDLVVANLISSELRPILAALAARVAAGGALVLSGLLEAERDAFQSALGALGLRVVAERCERDERGDAWLALTATR